MSFFPRDLTVPASAPGLPIEWEEASCPLCGGRRWSPLVEAPEAEMGTGLWFAVVQCHDCGLCFTNPRPNLRSMGQFYPAVYPPHHSTWKRLRRPKQPRRLWLSGRVKRRGLEWHGAGRLLDFGCGGGSFLAEMRALGWQVTGIDISASTVCRVRDDFGVRVLHGSLPHAELDNESFDVITMWHSLEHVHAPKEVLREAYRLLMPGGRLLVAVPNIDSLSYRWFGRHWFGLDLPRHLTHFTPWTLPLMLERTGFRVGPVRLVRHSQWMRLSAERARHDRRSPYWFHFLRNKPVSRVATWYSYATNQSDCILATAIK
jgi:SAM-dependent methyltransferase